MRESSHHRRVSLHETLPAGCEPTCHGCRHRHLSTEASLAQKSAYLARVLGAWGDRLQPVRSAGAAARFGYRDRVTLNAGWDEVLGWRFGLMRRDELIAIPDCPVHSARVNALTAVLRNTLPPAGQLPVAYVHVAGAQATLIVKARTFDPDALDALERCVSTTGLRGLWVHCHPAAGRRLFARSGWHLLWGEARSLGSSGLEHGPTEFQQLLPELHAASIDIAAGHLAPCRGTAVLDLYCGIGATLRRWTAAGAEALGVELGGGAVECARVNAPRARVLRGTCVQRLPQVREWWRALDTAGVAYVNPPRSGLEPDLVQALAAELRPARIAYLSCSAGTLARDLRHLEAHGHSVSALVPFDFFPGTHHVECLALLEDRRPLAAS
jgi:23S rRNA (uracil1939-C5)-methyltransferase